MVTRHETLSSNAPRQNGEAFSRLGSGGYNSQRKCCELKWPFPVSTYPQFLPEFFLWDNLVMLKTWAATFTPTSYSKSRILTEVPNRKIKPLKKNDRTHLESRECDVLKPETRLSDSESRWWTSKWHSLAYTTSPDQRCASKKIMNEWMKVQWFKVHSKAKSRLSLTHLHQYNRWAE